MSNIYLKVTIEKTNLLKILIFKIQKICFQVSFWGARNQADIIEF